MPPLRVEEARLTGAERWRSRSNGHRRIVTMVMCGRQWERHVARHETRPDVRSRTCRVTRVAKSVGLDGALGLTSGSC